MIYKILANAIPIQLQTCTARVARTCFKNIQLQLRRDNAAFPYRAHSFTASLTVYIYRSTEIADQNDRKNTDDFVFFFCILLFPRPIGTTNASLREGGHEREGDIELRRLTGVSIRADPPDSRAARNVYGPICSCARLH